MKNCYLSLFISLFLISACDQKTSSYESNQGSAAPYEIATVLEHDPNAFTQGLLYHEGKLYESTGGDNSWIAEIDPVSGQSNKKVTLDAQYFGEGITILNNKVYQLTWKSKVGFIYDYPSFEKIGEFNYEVEGWGITHNNQHLIMSDGSDKLYYLDPLNLNVVETQSITENGEPSQNLNELEFVNGYIYANEWGSSYVLKIDPNRKMVVQRIDLGQLSDDIKRTYPDANVLNGIAYNKTTKQFLVTGKLWPKSYLLKIK